MGLTKKFVLSSPSFIFIFTSKKLTSPFQHSTVNFVVEWNMLTCSIKTFKDSSPFQNEKYIIYIPPPNH